MASSGVAVQDAVVTEYNALKLNKKYDFTLLKLTDDLKEIEILQLEPRSSGERKTVCPDIFKKFVDTLPQDQCRYGVFDLTYEKKDGSGIRDSLVFFVWCPDTAKVKQKMLYASSKDALKKKLVGISVEMQASTLDDLDFKEVVDKADALKG